MSFPSLRPWATGLALFTLTACAAPNDGTTGQDTDVDRLQVVTTFLPITQFTQAVAGDCADVTQLLPASAGPHDYQAKPTDAQRLSQADVLVQNGLELERFLAPMVESASNGSLLVIDSSEGVNLLPMGEGEHHAEDHDVEQEETHEEDHDDDHDHDQEEETQDAGNTGNTVGEGHDHGQYDPHIWLDPVRAVGQINNIRDGLIAAEPGCTAEFTANAAAYEARLKALHEATAAALAPFAGKTFVTYHDFAGYFGDRYGLQIEFLVGVPEQNPSPSDVQRVMETVQTSELKTLLVESPTSAQPFEAIAQDLNVKLSTFSPNAVGDSDDPEAYFTVMEENVANLQTAFAGE